MEMTFNGRLRPKQNEATDWSDLTKLTNEKLAFVYERLSSHEQTKRSIYSIKAQDALEDLAVDDGYDGILSLEQREGIKRATDYPGWYQNGQIIVEQRDMGISGTKGREERPGLEHLIQKVESGLIEAVYVVHVSRLYRDQTLINALALGELFKQHDVIIITPQMRLNLRDKMHLRLYRMEVERAADELELMAQRLLGARNLKAKAGYYAGATVPAGYIVDECKVLDNGELNPNYHTYRIYEPHAKVVRIIFDQLSIPGMTPTRILRYCNREGITFAQFLPELDTSINRQSFVKTQTNPDGSWPVTTNRIRSIATNPAYIGWKVWSGEVVSKNAYPSIVDEVIFWAVQERFKKHPKPKKGNDPLPLSGLLHCGNHEVLKSVQYVNAISGNQANYLCCNRGMDLYCVTISAHFLDEPVAEAVISQVTVPGLAEQVLQKLTNEYEQAKEQTASYCREVKRLETEIENLRTNLAMGILSDNQISWIDDQILDRLSRIKELADLEKQPIGLTIGKSTPDQTDFELVKSFLSNLSETWLAQPNGLKNTFLRLLLDKVVIYHESATIRAKLVWRVGLEQEILIHKTRKKAHRKWTEEEIKMLHRHFLLKTMDEMMELLPDRTDEAIRGKARSLGLRKPYIRGKDYTAEDDEIIRRYAAGEIS